MKILMIGSRNPWRMQVALQRVDLLTPKLPTPEEDDLAKGILDAIDMDSYRVEKRPR